MFINEYVLHRYEKNPVISPKDFPGAQVLTNPGQTMYKGKTILLLSACIPQNGRATSHLAESEDGINFKIHEQSFFCGWDKPPFNIAIPSPIDSRITKIRETYYIVNPGPDNDFGDMAILGKTDDWITYEPIEIIAAPSNRVPSLFPEKIGGFYAKLDRPFQSSDDPGFIWISYSPDLIHWGRFRLLFQGRRWAVSKVGPTPPVKTPEGWLVIFHGVKDNCNCKVYSIGALLLDLNDPEKIIGMTRTPILTPDAPYERMGHTPNVVFPCGCITDEEKDEIRLYYGAADTSTCLATGKLSELLYECRRYNTWD